MQTLVVIAIIGTAGIYSARNFLRVFRTGSCGCGCSGCGFASTCGMKKKDK